MRPVPLVSKSFLDGYAVELRARVGRRPTDGRIKMGMANRPLPQLGLLSSFRKLDVSCSFRLIQGSSPSSSSSFSKLHLHPSSTTLPGSNHAVRPHPPLPP